MADKQPGEYGYRDTSFRTMGGEAGIRRLVDRFYDLMRDDPRAAAVRAMHPQDLSLSREKLAAFLCGWLGGPKLYRERWGPIYIPPAHAHLNVTQREHDEWLWCMDQAVDTMSVPQDFKDYFKREIRVPAGRVLKLCQQRAAEQ